MNAIVKKIIEWALKAIWPEVKKFIEDKLIILLKEFFIGIVNNIKRVFADFTNGSMKREKEAKEKEVKAEKAANEADKQSREAETAEETMLWKAEAEKHMAIAKVWREVFESYRSDNEELEKKLQILHLEFENTAIYMTQRTRKSLQILEIEDVIEMKDERFKLKDNIQFLDSDV